MKPAPFDYAAPASLEAALALKAKHGDDAKFLAGGQSLIPAMNFRLVQAHLLVDLNGLADLDYVRRADDGRLRLGAMVRQRRLERDSAIAGHSPLIHETMPFVAHPQIRNRGTLGGCLAHADPAAELPVIAVALGARFKTQSTRGERWIAAEDFFRGMFNTDLTPEEMLVEVELPRLPPRTGTAFVEFARRRGDYALLGVAAVVTLDEKGVCQQARLVYLNAGDGPVNAKEAAGILRGEKPSAAVIEAASAKAAQAEIAPLGNVHASPEYQRHLARVLGRRVLRQAFDRAGSQGK
ncbi:MAG: xanthine dehydrogenase family protein subunit M [Chloroflexi bacterium]|nr:xanthine dehydrogenase family protein subunit M [Chloroflexota bacterium]